MRDDQHLAIKLRKKKKSYNEISELLKIPKSTLHYWFKGKPWSEKIKKDLTKKLQKSARNRLIAYSRIHAQEAAKKREEYKEKAFKEFSKEIKRLSQRDLKLIGLALYWAEGANKNRNSLRFCNSDPLMIKIMMKFFREICNVPNEKIKARIHLYPKMSQKGATSYWRKITALPMKNFLKIQTQVSRASKGKRRKNTLPYGTLHLSVNSTELTSNVKGWIQGITNQF